MAWRLGNGKLRKDQTDHYGRIKNGGGGGGASVEDFVDSTDIKFSLDATTEKIKAVLTDAIKSILENALTDEDFDDSDDILLSEVEDKLTFVLSQAISDKIDSALQPPTEVLTQTELVGLNTDKSQARITPDGTSIVIQNNQLKAIGGGGGGASINDFVDSDSIEFEVDTVTSKIKAVIETTLLALINSALQSSDLETSSDIVVNTSGGKLNFTLVTALATKIANALTGSNLDDSEEIVLSEDEGVYKFNLAQTISNKIANSLQTPLQTPTENELVGIDTSKSQTRITIGSGLQLDNDVLSVVFNLPNKPTSNGDYLLNVANGVASWSGVTVYNGEIQ